MKTPISTYVFLINFSICTTTFSQSNTFSFSKFSIRQSFQAPTEENDPAKFSFTTERGQLPKYNIGMAVKYDLLSFFGNLNIMPFIEWNKDTYSKDETNKMGTGLSIEYHMLEINDHNSWTPIFFSTVNYNKNFITENTGMIATITTTPVFVCPWAPNTSNDLLFFDIQYMPFVGIEYESLWNNSIKESDVRLFTRIGMLLLPFPDKLSGNLQLTMDYYFREDIFDNIDVRDKSHPLFKASIKYKIPFGKLKTGISFDYLVGEDLVYSYQFKEKGGISINIQM